MTIVSNGAISLGGNTTSGGFNQSIEFELKSTYGTSGSNTITLNDSPVRSLGNANSGSVSISGFYGRSSFTPVTHTYNTAGSNTETIPSGASQVVITITGGGGGGTYHPIPFPGTAAGGSGAGTAIKTISVAGSETVNYTLGLPGAQAGSGAANNGSASSATGTLLGGTINLVAQGGKGLQDPSYPVGGTATGGDSNITGNPASGSFGGTPNGGSAPAPGASNGTISFAYT